MPSPLDRLPLAQKRFPLFEDIFRRSDSQPGMTPLRPGVGGVPRPLYGDAVAPPQAPSSLFSPEDIHNARSEAALRFGSALLAGSGKGRPIGSAPGFPAALGAATQAGSAGYDAGLKNSYGVRSAQQAAQLRARIQAQYPEQPNETTPQTMARLEKIFAALVQGGDTEGAGKIGEVLKSYGGGNQAKVTAPHLQDFGNYFQTLDPVTGQPFGPRIPKTPSPKDPNAPDTAALRRTAIMEQRESSLSRQFQSATTKYEDVAGMIGVMQASGDAALAGDAAAQQSMIYGISKLNDPGSSVKEGEYATVENAQGWGEKARNEYNKALRGQSLDAEAVKRYLGQAERLRVSWKKKFDMIMRQFERRANAWGVDPQNVILDFFAGSDPVAAKTQSPSAASSAAGVLNLPSFPVRTP